MFLHKQSEHCNKIVMLKSSITMQLQYFALLINIIINIFDGKFYYIRATLLILLRVFKLFYKQLNQIIQFIFTIITQLTICSLLAYTLLVLQTELQPDMHHKWHYEYWFRFTGKSVMNVSVVYKEQHFIGAGFYSILATCGYNIPYKYAWLFITPWLAMSILCWCNSFFNILQLLWDAAEADNVSQVFVLLIWHCLVQGFVIVDVGLFTYQRFTLMGAIQRDTHEQAAFRKDLESLLK